MEMVPYEKKDTEMNIQGIPVKKIMIGGGALIVATLIIWLVNR